MKNLNFKLIQRDLENWIKEKVGDRGVVIGLSGGIDSSVTCILAKNALGANKVKGIILDNSKFSREVGMSTAEKFALDHGISIEKVDIKKVRQIILKTLPKINRKEIIPMATLDVRLCDLYLRTFAFIEGKIFLGTINSTERLCGWFPKGGLVGDFDLLGGLLKEQIKELAKVIGLENLIPTVSQEAKDICSGCGYLPEFEGIPYQVLDEILFILETSSSEEMALEKAQSQGLSEDHFNRVLSRVKQTKHKRVTFPEFLRINFSNGETSK